MRTLFFNLTATRIGRSASGTASRTAASLGLLVLGFGLPSCDNVDAGRLELDPKPPKITRILVQEANTYQVTDLLNIAPALDCSDTNPCPVGTAGLGPTMCNVDEITGKGKCDNPTSASNPVFVSGDGALQVRIILSKILDPSVEKVMTDAMGNKTFALADPTAISVTGSDGKEISGDKYYDNTGSNTDAADAIGEPLGPALVINIPDQLTPSMKYTVKINGGAFKDDKNQFITETILGALDPNGYTFTAESLYVADVAPKVSAVAPNDVVTFTTNAFVADASLMATVTKMGSMTPEVNAIAWPDLDPMTCMAASGNAINVALTDGMGQPVKWAAGASYKIVVTAKDAASGKVTIDANENTITVTSTDGDAEDPQTFDKRPLPVPCKDALAPKDGGTTD